VVSEIVHTVSWYCVFSNSKNLTFFWIVAREFSLTFHGGSVCMQLSELGEDDCCHLVVELNKLTASLLLGEDSQPCEEMKMRRTGGTSQWLWYWQHDDRSWRAYNEACPLSFIA